MTACVACGDGIRPIEKWASECGCGVKLSRRSFLVGLGALAAAAVAGVSVTQPQPLETAQEILMRIYAEGIRRDINTIPPALKLLMPKARRHGMTDIYSQLYRFHIRGASPRIRT